MKGHGFRTELEFGPSPTVWDFLLADNFVTGIMGPLGSGKSVGCCAKIMKKAIEQWPNSEGWRRTRWLVIRNTYVELKSTTIKTWLEVFPEAACGPMRWSAPITHRIREANEDGNGGIDIEVIFMALDRPQDIKHLKSLDLTGAWINEACEVPVEILDMLTGRVGRFPPWKEEGARWAGIIMDTNASDDQNWYYDLTEAGGTLSLALDPEIFGGMDMDFSWKFWRQPPAVLEVEPVMVGKQERYVVKEAGFPPFLVMPTRVVEGAGRFWTVNPGAENVPFLRPGYYFQQIARKDLAWIERFLQCKFVYWVPGRPWIPEYNDNAMSARLEWDPQRPLLGGIDAGSGSLSPAAVIGQRGMWGDWRFLSEFCAFDMGIDRFGTGLHLHLSERYKGSMPLFYLDPATKARDEIFETAVEEHLRKRKFQVQIAPTNDPDVIREAYANACNRAFNVHGKLVPGFQVDKSCKILRAGLAGKWHRRQMQVTGAPRFVERPEKNKWSHACDAGGELLVGGGEHASFTKGLSPEVASAKQIVERDRRLRGGKPVFAKTDFDPRA